MKKLTVLAIALGVASTFSFNAEAGWWSSLVGSTKAEAQKEGQKIESDATKSVMTDVNSEESSLEKKAMAAAAKKALEKTAAEADAVE